VGKSKQDVPSDYTELCIALTPEGMKCFRHHAQKGVDRAAVFSGIMKTTRRDRHIKYEIALPCTEVNLTEFKKICNLVFLFLLTTTMVMDEKVIFTGVMELARAKELHYIRL
jgi:hypothetical protein